MMIRSQFSSISGNNWKTLCAPRSWIMSRARRTRISIPTTTLLPSPFGTGQQEWPKSGQTVYRCFLNVVCSGSASNLCTFKIVQIERDTCRTEHSKLQTRNRRRYRLCVISICCYLVHKVQWTLSCFRAGRTASGSSEPVVVLRLK